MPLAHLQAAVAVLHRRGVPYAKSVSPQPLPARPPAATSASTTRHERRRSSRRAGGICMWLDRELRGRRRRGVPREGEAQPARVLPYSCTYLRLRVSRERHCRPNVSSKHKLKRCLLALSRGLRGRWTRLGRGPLRRMHLIERPLHSPASTSSFSSSRPTSSLTRRIPWK